MFRSHRPGALKSIPARRVFPARIAATTVAGYASANENADAKLLLLINKPRLLNNLGT